MEVPTLLKEIGEKVRLSIGVPVHNEAERLKELIESIKAQDIYFQELIFILSGCNDDSEQIIQSSVRGAAWDRVRIIKQSRREGKASAINLFLNEAEGDVLIMLCSDLKLEQGCLRKLVQPLTMDPFVGMTGARPIPVTTGSFFMDRMNQIIWQLHHLVNLIRPKLGEAVAFRRPQQYLPYNCAADEVFLEAVLKKEGLSLVYQPEAIVRNKCPTTLRDLFCQRVRIFWAHLDVRKRTGYEAASMDTVMVLKRSIAYLLENPRMLPYLLFAMGLESTARLKARFKFYVSTGDAPYIWEKYDK